MGGGALLMWRQACHVYGLNDAPASLTQKSETLQKVCEVTHAASLTTKHPAHRLLAYTW